MGQADGGMGKGDLEWAEVWELQMKRWRKEIWSWRWGTAVGLANRGIGESRPGVGGCGEVWEWLTEGLGKAHLEWEVGEVVGDGDWWTEVVGKL